MKQPKWSEEKFWDCVLNLKSPFEGSINTPVNGQGDMKSMIAQRIRGMLPVSKIEK